MSLLDVLTQYLALSDLMQEVIDVLFSLPINRR